MDKDYRKPVTEAELEKRDTKGERVTLDQLERDIAQEFYYNPEEIHPLTVCVLKLHNGFMVVGHSAPAVAANFNEEIGRRLAREQAVKQLWHLRGYALRDRIYQEEKAGESGGK